MHGGFSDWRLPTTLQPDPTCSIQSGGVSYGYNCTGSELGHMFYEHLGGNAFESVINQTNDTAEEIANLALFTNVQSHDDWSGTEYTPGIGAWSFNTDFGIQNLSDQDFELYAVAVRPGDVAAPMPEPQSLVLAGLALGAAAYALRKRPV